MKRAIRKIIGVLMLGLAWSLPSLAQQYALGIKGGPLLTLSNFGDKDDGDNYSHKVKPGFYVAGLVVFPLKNQYSLQTEFGFSQRGRRITFNSDEWENNATYYFVDGAMLLRKSFPFQLGRNIPSTWFVDIGPHISYWLGGKGKVSAGGSYNYTIVFEEMPESPPEPDFNTMYIVDENQWLFGLDIGVGFEAPIAHKKDLLVELRFTSGHTFYGMRGSASNRTLGFSDNLRSNEKVLSLTVAYILDINIQENRKGKSTKDKEINKPRRRR
jgi:hypothetical protein